MAQRQFRTDDTSVWAERYGDGKDGALTVSGNSTHSCANQSCSGTSGSTTLTLDSAGTFANGDLVMIHQTRGTTGGGAGMWELNKISSGAGTTTLTMAYALQNTYTASGADQAQVVELKEYTSVTINGGVTYSSPAWNGTVGGIIGWICNGTTTVTGTITVNGATTGNNIRTATSGGGFMGGAASTSDAVEAKQSNQGEGTGGGGGASTSANGNGGGGGSNPAPSDTIGGGAGGGNGATGSNGGAQGGTGGTAGSSAGSASLVTMVFGGGGGGSSPNGNGGRTAGGSGAGICFIISKTITVTGSITANGGGGGTGDWAAGGGGAGGSVLLKGQTLTLGSSLITASAGAAGVATNSTGDGGAGSVGRIHCDYSQTLSGTTSPTLDSSQDLVLNDLPSIENYTLLM